MARKRAARKAARKAARQSKRQERKATRQSGRQERKSARSGRKTSRQESRQSARAERRGRKTTRQSERQQRKSRKQSARQERTQTRAERPTRYETRAETKQARIAAKEASGWYSPEAVESRQETLRTGIGTWGDVAGTAVETTGEFLESYMTGGLSDVGEAAGGFLSDLDLSGVSDYFGAEEELEETTEAATWYDDLPPWAIPAAVVAGVGAIYFATREPPKKKKRS